MSIQYAKVVNFPERMLLFCAGKIGGCRGKLFGCADVMPPVFFFRHKSAYVSSLADSP